MQYRVRKIKDKYIIQEKYLFIWVPAYYKICIPVSLNKCRIIKKYTEFKTYEQASLAISLIASEKLKRGNAYIEAICEETKERVYVYNRSKLDSKLNYYSTTMNDLYEIIGKRNYRETMSRLRNYIY